MESESDSSQSDNSGCLLLHEIAANNDVQLLSKLLSFFQTQGAEINLNQKNKKGRTPLHAAAINNRDRSHFKFTEILLKNGADVNAKDKHGRTALWYLVQNSCNFKILKLFFNFKADFVNADEGKSSILSLQVRSRCNNLDVVKFLVQDAGLDVNHRDEKGNTPLHCAAYSNEIDSHYQLLECLLEMGADVNARNSRGLTPLYALIGRGNWKVIELFLKHNADVHALSNCGENLFLGYCIKGSNASNMQKLISDFGLDVNHADSEKRTPLHNILDFDLKELVHIELIKCLLTNGANINSPDKYGLTPLILTVNCIGEEKFIKRLDCFSFIMDQVDFSVVHENIHVLENYLGDEGVEGNHQSHPENIWKWFLEHLAKLNYLNIPIHPIVLEFIENHMDHKNYFEKCTEELQVMKKTKLQNSWVTLFNLLVDSRRKLKNYAGNLDLVKDYKKRNCLKKIPIYGASMKKNVEKGIKRRELFDKSSIFLSDCLPIFDSNHLIVKNILDCILSTKELSKLCN